MSNVAFIGDIDVISGFKAIGADAVEVENKEQLSLILEELSKNGYKIIFILEGLAALAQDVIEK
ncbi:MAG: hypothetical protein NC828_00175 [Candidatus Omnitrophica bacterium]|nr:hypothetical protein [Candidatus Omnitrophota bacterium]